MTLFALGAKWGLPSGGAHSFDPVVAAKPSRCRSDPSTSPTKPMPQSERNARRLAFPHEQAVIDLVMMMLLSNGNEFAPVEQRVDQIFTRAQLRIDCRGLCANLLREWRDGFRAMKQRGLPLQEFQARGCLCRRRRSPEDRFIGVGEEGLDWPCG